jgi:tetratricopeptide (TPR) repeat protein
VGDRAAPTNSRLDDALRIGEMELATQRHSNHELEDLSRAALRMRLPRRWVIHDYSRDYGIDAQLEIFDEGGGATGLRCYVQLKATENREGRDGLSLERRHLEYWQNHVEPVLLLRYYADGNDFAWCWIDDIAWRIRDSSDSIAVGRQLRPLDSGSIQAIAMQLAARRDVLVSGPSPPFSVGVSVSSGRLVEAHEIASDLRKHLPRPSFVVTAEPTVPTHFGVSIDSEWISTSHVGLPGARLASADLDPAVKRSEVVALLLFVTASKFERTAAARQILTSPRTQVLDATPDGWEARVWTHVFSVLGAKDAAAALLRCDRFTHQPSFWPLLLAIGTQVAEERGDTHSWIQVLADLERDPPIEGFGANCSYNVGNALLNNGRYEEALAAFDRALVEDNAYSDRSYYWFDVGAAAFEAAEFPRALVAYRKAIDLSGDTRDLWKIGDAHFHLGEFGAAQTALGAWLELDVPSDGSYQRLIYLICQDFADNWGITNSHLHPVADDVYAEFDKLEPSDLNQDRFASLLAHNALDALLNFNVGAALRRLHCYRSASIRYATTALAQRGDVEAWALAFLSAYEAGDVELVALIAGNAYFCVAEDVIAEVGRLVTFGPEVTSNEQENFLRSIQEIFRASARSSVERRVTVRLLGDSAAPAQL